MCILGLAGLEAIHQLLEVASAFCKELLPGTVDLFNDGIFHDDSYPSGSIVNSSGVTMTGVSLLNS